MQLPQSKTSCQSPWIEPQQECMALFPFITLTCTTLKCGYKDPTFALKLSKNFIVKPLTYLINLIFKTGIYPNDLKLAKVIPIYKGGDPQNFSNYRPISLLSNINKIIEKCIYSRLYNFIESKKILSNFQYGFRNKSNCEIALIDFTDKIASNIDSGQLSLAVFLDISKAFDMVDFNILKCKLNKIGIRGSTLNLLYSYLTNRRQLVYCNNIHSNIEGLDYGVPQGSILGPLLFLIYINDLPNCLQFCNITMYADDVVIWYSHNCLNELFNILAYDLININSWYNGNKLAINFTKSNYIIFRSHKKKLPIDLPVLSIGNNDLQRVNHCKYLGLYLHEFLKWDHHIKYISIRIATYVGLLSKIRHYFSIEICLLYYYAFIHSHISYGLSIYGRTYNSTLNPISILQKKAVRIIIFADYMEPSKPIFKKLNILTVTNLCKYNICLLLFKIINNLIISNLKSNLIMNINIHSHNTRYNNKSNIVLHTIKSNYGRFKFSFLGPLIWNKLDNNLKDYQNLCTYKKLSKSFDWESINI